MINICVVLVTLIITFILELTIALCYFILLS